MKKKTQRLFIKLGLFGMIQYILILILVIFMYHGGDRFNPSYESYNFFGSFISDLGRMHAFSGMPTYDTGIIYGFALVFNGLGVLFFFIAHRYLILGSNKILRFLGTLAGIVSGIGYIGVGLTPWDLFPHIHLFSVFLGFISFIFASAITGICVLQDSKYPKVSGYIFIGFALFLASYIALMIFGPESSTPVGRIAQATGQKILVFTQVILMTIIGVKAIKHTYK